LASTDLKRCHVHYTCICIYVGIYTLYVYVGTYTRIFRKTVRANDLADKLIIERYVFIQDWIENARNELLFI